MNKRVAGIVLVISVVAGWRYYRSMPVKTPLSYLGNWESACRGPGAGHAAPWRVYVNFEKINGLVYYVLYEDAYCQKIVAINRSTMTYQLTRRQDSRSHNIDTSYTRFYWRCITESCVKSARKTKMHGFRNEWVVGREIDITGTSAGGGAPPLKSGSIQYDIVRVIQGKLNYGDNKTGSTETPADRPTEFEEDTLYYQPIISIPTKVTLVGKIN